MNNTKNDNLAWLDSGFSWIIILILLFTFFPAGIIFIIMKTRLHRRSVFTTHRKIKNTGVAIIVMTFIIAVIDFFSQILKSFENEKNITDTMLSEYIKDNFWKTFTTKYYGLCLAVGVTVIIISIFIKRKAKKHQKYIDLVANRGYDDLDKISSMMKLAKSIVIDDLEYLIKKGYLEDYEVRRTENRIVHYIAERERKRREEEQMRVTPKSIKCKNCGGTNMIAEKIIKCNYCGSYIEYK